MNIVYHIVNETNTSEIVDDDFTQAEYTYCMALFIRQDDERSELQKQVAAELQRKARDNSLKAAERPDGVEDSQYIKSLKKTSNMAWIWIVIFVIIVGLIIWLTVISMSR
jgi:hypothetical protein